MKKKIFKLNLKKVNISNLSSLQGGTEIHTVSKNWLDLCCPILGTGECEDTQLTTCHTGNPNCDNYSNDCVYTHRSHCC